MGGSFARSLTPGQLFVTSHNDANQLTQRGAAILTYDDNGNLTSDGANSYTWNARNQLSSMSDCLPQLSLLQTHRMLTCFSGIQIHIRNLIKATIYTEFHLTIWIILSLLGENSLSLCKAFV
ncbi:MAG TPA: hypothetical protein VGC89_07195 [Pyrinomonadaceae bacterium]|jgi:hypothetical protein